MAKRTSNSSVNSSIRQQTQSNEQGLSQLLAAQQASLGELTSIRELMELSTEVLPRENRQNEETLELQKEQLKLMNEEASERKSREDEVKKILDTMKTWKSPLDKMQEGFQNLKTKLSPENIKKGFLESTNFMGMNTKKLEKDRFKKEQKALGFQGSEDELNDKFEKAYTTKQASEKNDKQIEKIKAAAGGKYTAEEIAKTNPEMANLLKKKSAITEEYSQHDLGVKAKGVELRPETGVKLAEKPELTKFAPKTSAETVGIPKSPTQEFADAGAAEENMLEQNKMVAQQTELLSKIEQNTRGDSPLQKAKPKEEAGGGGGLLSGLLSGGGGKALAGLKNFGVGLVLVAGALWVAAKAFQSFAEVAWEDVGKGLVALGGLVLAAMGLDKVKGNIIAGGAALGVMALALWGISTALKTFSDLEWETIGKGMVAIAGLGIIGAIAGGAAAPIALGAAALGLLGGALWIIGKAMQAVGEGFDQMNEGLQKLSELDGENLLKVAAGIGAIGIAMAAFGAGQAVAGLGNLVSKFLSLGSDSPVEQLIKIGQNGEGVMKAAEGLDKIGAAMEKFGKVDKKSMEAVNDFPWVRATAFVAAGGAMSVDGAKVYNASKSNKDESAKVDAQNSGGSTNVVNAPVTNTSKTTQVIPSAIRNQDSTNSKYLERRYARA